MLVQGRCAALLMFHTQLALLPAMETEGLELDLMMDDPYGEGVEGARGAPAELVSATVGNSYVVNLAKMGIKQVHAPPHLHPQCSPYTPAQQDIKYCQAKACTATRPVSAVCPFKLFVIMPDAPLVFKALLTRKTQIAGLN